LIISSLDQPENASKDLSIPWRSVLTSGPFLAIFVAHICSNFGWYMLLIELPTYMKQVLKFDIQQVSFKITPNGE
jgi:MFS transporter, ACS family, solute carrier family 17 (sodium-dependent inorganic phosphate cotransporter), other